MNQCCGFLSIRIQHARGRMAEQAGSKERLVPRGGEDFGARVRPSACVCVGLSVYMWVCLCASELAGIRLYD